jgi:hypothetical protein
MAWRPPQMGRGDWQKRPGRPPSSSEDACNLPTLERMHVGLYRRIDRMNRADLERCRTRFSHRLILLA